MSKECSFYDIKNYLEKPGKVGKEIIDAFDCLADAAIIFCPAILGPEFLPLLNVLDIKDRVVNIGKKVFDCITQRMEPDYITRNEQIKVAYALISYTAFFDSLSEAIPKKYTKKLKDETIRLRGELDETGEVQEKPLSSITISDYYADHVVSFTEVINNISQRYQKASEYLYNSIDAITKDSSIIEKKEVSEIKKKLKGLPKKAIARYEAQYLELANKYNDFALFAQHQFLKKIDFSLFQNKTTLELIASRMDNIDVGLKYLHEIVNSYNTNYIDIQAQAVVDDLKTRYTALINEPIIEAKEIEADSNKIDVVFPKIAEAFIPQSYKALSYDNSEIELEDGAVWEALEAQKDLNSFFIRYLCSLDSIDNPLIVLGQPGSGKSLLTKVLSAQLMSESYTVVRIPLRDVNADAGIDVLVEDQIKKVTNRSISSWGYGGFASQFKERPLIIILDGYDELLQAKGELFSGYLEKVRSFQLDQKAMNRPVRIIVTSRITLIDKAKIPLNSTIIRLMEFDPDQQEKWITIWNNTNSAYFKKANISPFELPKTKGKNNSVLDLAEQPLLLLMLALYDSESNELAKNKNINRTELYDKLIRKFVRRERSRYVAGFAEKNQAEQEQIIDEEMKRLGIVAIGMYNRRGVVIRSKELEADLNTFQSHRKESSSKYHSLKESDSVLGSFFFIHQSTAHDVEAHSDQSESAYEFLHNTFGEFLAADFILRNTTDIVLSTFVYKSCNLPLPESFDIANWLYCLMFVPLYTRPVVIEMMREHICRSLNNTNKSNVTISLDQYTDTLKSIVEEQLQMILTTTDVPKVMFKNNMFDSEMSLLGYLSTYSLNLIVLVSALSKNGFELNESEYIQFNNKTRDLHPWNELTSLWKVWFPQMELMGLSVILKAKRISDNTILIKCNEKFEATRYEQPIDVMLCVSYALGDDLLTGLSGLVSHRFSEITKLTTSESLSMYANTNADLYFSYVIRLLRTEVHQLQTINDIVNYSELIGIIDNLICSILLDKKIHWRQLSPETLLSLVHILEYCLSHKLIRNSTRSMVFRVIEEMSEAARSLSFKTAELWQYISLYDCVKCYDMMEYILSRVMPRYEYGDAFSRLSLRGIRSNGYVMVLQEQEMSYSERLFCYRIFSVLDEEHSDLENTGPFKDFFIQAVDVLSNVNPDLVLEILSLLFSRYKYAKKTHLEKIEEIISYGLNCIAKCGIRYLRLDTIYKAIVLAKKVKKNDFLQETSDLLVARLLSYDFSIIGKILFYNPIITSEYISIIPQKKIRKIIPGISAYLREASFNETYLQGVNTETIFSHIKILLFILGSKIFPGSTDISLLLQYVNYLAVYILEKIGLYALSTEQIDELNSIAELSGNKQIIIQISLFKKNWK